VVTSLVQLLCRTTKLAWFDSDHHRNIVDDAKVFLEKGTPSHYLLGLKILHALVSEMNSPTAGRTLTQHRKIAVSFRDQSLFKIFQLSLVALKQLSDTTADIKLREQVLPPGRAPPRPHLTSRHQICVPSSPLAISAASHPTCRVLVRPLSALMWLLSHFAYPASWNWYCHG
jgi:hypothetical protein